MLSSLFKEVLENIFSQYITGGRLYDMALKFAANLNFLFTEKATRISERIKLAHLNGFRAVEIPYPEGETQAAIEAIKDTGIVVSLINIAFGMSHESN